jgi:hypothetical protein
MAAHPVLQSGLGRSVRHPRLLGHVPSLQDHRREVLTAPRQLCDES